MSAGHVLLKGNCGNQTTEPFHFLLRTINISRLAPEGAASHTDNWAVQ